MIFFTWVSKTDLFYMGKTVFCFDVLRLSNLKGDVVKVCLTFLMLET